MIKFSKFLIVYDLHLAKGESVKKIILISLSCSLLQAMESNFHREQIQKFISETEDIEEKSQDSDSSDCIVIDDMETSRTLEIDELVDEIFYSILHNNEKEKQESLELACSKNIFNESQELTIYLSVINKITEEIEKEKYVNMLVKALESKDVEKIKSAYRKIFTEPLMRGEPRLLANQENQCQIACMALRKLKLSINS